MAEKIRLAKHFHRPMHDYINGEPLAEPVAKEVNGETVTARRTVTFGMIAVRACMNALKGDEQDESGRARAFALGVKIAGAGSGEVLLDMDDLVFLKERVRKAYAAPLIAEQMAAFIDEAEG